MDKVCVIGGVTWDVLFVTPEAKLVSMPRVRQRFLAFPYGGKLDAQNIVYGFGGGAANVSVGLRRLGVDTAILSRIGQDWRGREVLENLKRERVITALLQRDPRELTPLSFVVTTGGPRDHVAFVARGSTHKLGIPNQLPGLYSWLYITSLATPNWSQQMGRLLRGLAVRKQQVFWNPGRKQLSNGLAMRKLLKYVTILDLNREEAEYLVRDLHLKSGTIAELLVALHRVGAKNVLITEGVRGAHFYDGHTMYYHHALEVRPVNTTGAGDAFGSGFLAGYLRTNGNIVKAMRWGMLNATSVILQAGAQRGLLTLGQLRSFERKYVRARSKN